jgi:cobalt-zinc-cadmium efflux system membrane fusion protein
VGGEGQAKELYVISDLSVVEADLAVPAKYLAAVREGQPVSLTTATSRVFEGKVAVVDAMITQETRSGRVIARFENRDLELRPGSLFNARIALAETRVKVRVPRTAVQTVGGEPAVFVRTDDGFIKRKVETGAADHKFVEILAGLAPGEQIATTNAFILKAELGKKDFDPGL